MDVFRRIDQLTARVDELTELVETLRADNGQLANRLAAVENARPQTAKTQDVRAARTTDK